MRITDYLDQRIYQKKAPQFHPINGVTVALCVGDYYTVKKLGFGPHEDTDIEAAYRECFQYLVDKYGWEKVLKSISKSLSEQIKIAVETNHENN